MIIHRLLPGIAAGLVAGIRTVIGSAALAALIFSNDLALGVPQGVAIMLITGGVLGGIVALLSSYPGTVGQPQDGPAVVLALMGAAMAAALPRDLPAEAKIGAVLAAISLASLLTGACFLAIGALRLGSLVRFLPYPVVGGFLAGSGWLLATGSISVMTGIPLRPDTIALLLTPHIMMRWVPALVFALAVLGTLQRSNHFLVVPGAMLAFGALFYAALAAWGVPVAQAQADGWLLGPFPKGTGPALFTLGHFRHFGQAIFIEQWPKFGTIVIVAAVQLLLNSSGLEFATQQDVDINRELRAAGLGNLAAGALGGPPGFQAMSASALGHLMGVNTRMIGLVSAGLCLAAFYAGTTALSYVPRMLVGGLLMFMGVSFLSEWLYRGWFRLPRADYAVVLLILGVTGLFGYMEGVATGIAAAIGIFIVACSKIKIIKQEMTGAEYRSSVDRDRRAREILDQRGRAILVLKLEGFIFFGTIHALVSRIEARIKGGEGSPLTHLVLDFKNVVGMDSSAVKGLNRLYDTCRARQCAFVLSGLSPDLKRQFENAGFDSVSAGGARLFEDLDQAVEDCEDELLASATLESPIAPVRWRDQLSAALPAQEKIDRFMQYMDVRDHATGSYLIRQGEQASDMFFIESGRITVRLQLADARSVRLRTMGAGTTVGEIGCYLGQMRSAAVIADQPTRAYRLTAEALRRMEERDPDLAAALHRYMVGLLADRLSSTAALLQKVLG
ncbi:MAG TPA: SulP family inorganic anion transporter [Stellaceae bacterium]|nr:SulP family inorganic anion transporter [Stellaceae bacterium]